MATREKFLVLLMAGAIGYGLFDFAMTHIRKGSLENQVDTVKKQSQDLIATSSTRLKAVALTPHEQGLLARVTRPWETGLFVESLHPPVVAKAPANGPDGKAAEQAVTPTYQYSGYLNINGRKLAVINGSEYEVGDAIGASTYVIDSIEALQVTLKRETGSQTLTLNLEQPETLTISQKQVLR